MLSSATMLMLLLILSSFLNQAFASLSSVDPISFYFSSFDSDDCGEDGELICWGSATAVNGYLDINPAPPQANVTAPSLPINSVGRVIHRRPVLAWPAVIIITFTVRISKYSNSTGSGDGVTFVMAEGNGPSPTIAMACFWGSKTGQPKGKSQLCLLLGLYGLWLKTKFIGGSIPRLAVELDTCMIEWDIDDNHVGIDTKSVRNSDTAVSLDSVGIDLKLGRAVQVKIEYDGHKKLLQVYAAYSGDPLVGILNHSLIMAETVPSSVYVGFTGSTGTVLENHQILDWFFTSFPLPKSSLKEGLDRRDEIKMILIVVFPIITGLLVLGTCTYSLVPRVCRTRNRQNKEEDIESRSRIAANAPKMFSLKQLSKATHNFSRDNLLGAGGFGSVYRGVLSNPSSTIAVKKISATSKQGEREYLAEICTIGCLRHKNILQLQGWCHDREHLLLVYEFMPNGSLDRYICNSSLEWETRYKILTGLASALLYLHEECGNNVVHRDVKPNNVMLDSNFNAHLGDFGLARLLQDQTAVTTMLAGTPGYLAPEYSYTGKATPESDVYSFEIVVLEVVCGRRSMGGVEVSSLVDYVWNLYGKDELLQCVDQTLEDKFKEEQVNRALVMGLACSHPDPVFRPKMRKVVQVFMNPSEPLIYLTESRPNAMYLSFQYSSASTANGLGSSATTSGSCLSVTLPDETVIQYGR